jgi:hypothetical protein
LQEALFEDAFVLMAVLLCRRICHDVFEDIHRLTLMTEQLASRRIRFAEGHFVLLEALIFLFYLLDPCRNA